MYVNSTVVNKAELVTECEDGLLKVCDTEALQSFNMYTTICKETAQVG